jgi:hypothetical protein
LIDADLAKSGLAETIAEWIVVQEIEVLLLE